MRDLVAARFPPIISAITAGDNRSVPFLRSRLFLRSIYATAAAALLICAPLAATAAGAKEPAPKRPAITGIYEIVLAAQDMAADKTFYTHTLGWVASTSPAYPNGLRFAGDRLQAVDVHPATSPDERAFDHVAWRTTDAEAMRKYLASKGVAVPPALTVLNDGEKTFEVKDPEGNTVEFVQALHGAGPQGIDAPNNISGRIIHTGFIVQSVAAEDSFYKNILGFHLYWEGGMKDGDLDFVAMQVPNGTDWVEYMLHAGLHPSKRQLGVDDHFSLGIADMRTVEEKLTQRGFPPGAQTHRQMGRDGKNQLNLYDPDGVRIEFMEFTPKETPCCHAIVGKAPGPNQQ
jgi:catechol 2,3-dioxygenase-like lactoylglutathione lyase family enzyme